MVYGCIIICRGKLNFFSAKVVIVDHPDVVREVYGTTKALQCVATGDPPPLISWLREGRPVSQDFPPKNSLTVSNKINNWVILLKTALILG